MTLCRVSPHLAELVGAWWPCRHSQLTHGGQEHTVGGNPRAGCGLLHTSLYDLSLTDLQPFWIHPSETMPPRHLCIYRVAIKLAPQRRASVVVWKLLIAFIFHQRVFGHESTRWNWVSLLCFPLSHTSTFCSPPFLSSLKEFQNTVLLVYTNIQIPVCLSSLHFILLHWYVTTWHVVSCPNKLMCHVIGHHNLKISIN